MNAVREGLLSVHMAVLIFGLTALFAKLIELPAMDITLLRSLFAVLVAVLYIKYKGESLRLEQPKDYAVAFFLGALLGGHWISYFHSIQVSSVAVGVISLFTFPVITVFLEPLFHGEKLQVADIFSALAVLFGVYLLVPGLDFSAQSAQGMLWGVLSAFLFALRNILQRRYFSHYPARHALLYQLLVIIVLLFPFSAEAIPSVTNLQWGQLLLLGIVFTALPHILFAHALLSLKAKTVSLVACIQVVYASLFSALLLGEIPTINTLLGGSIILMAAVMETGFRKQQ